jgi:hypothetical protein
MRRVDIYGRAKTEDIARSMEMDTAGVESTCEPVRHDAATTTAVRAEEPLTKRLAEYV